MTRTTKDAFTGEAVDETKVIAALGPNETLNGTARALIRHALEREGRGWVIARSAEPRDERFIEGLRLEWNEPGAGAQALDLRGDLEPPGRYDDVAPLARTERLQLVLETRAETHVLALDIGLLTRDFDSVRTVPVRLREGADVPRKTLEAVLHEAMVGRWEAMRAHHRAEESDDERTVEHQEWAEVRAARINAASAAEGDAEALKILTDAWLLGAITAGGTEYTIRIGDPTKGRAAIEVCHAEAAPA